MAKKDEKVEEKPKAEAEKAEKKESEGIMAKVKKLLGMGK